MSRTSSATEQAQHLPVERWDVVRFATRHDLPVDHNFLIDPFRTGVLRSVLSDGHEAIRRPRALFFKPTGFRPPYLRTVPSGGYARRPNPSAYPFVRQ